MAKGEEENDKSDDETMIHSLSDDGPLFTIDGNIDDDDDLLTFDDDGIQSVVNRATYFKNDLTSAVFEGFDSEKLEK